MFEENGRIDTNSEKGNEEVETGKKVVCTHCGEETIIRNKEFGEEIVCPKCSELING